MTIFAHMTKPERIILGIDPGTNVLGYGVLRQEGRKVTMEAMGVIDLRKCTDVYLKLGRIYSRVMGIIDAFHPDELAIEAPFFGKNVQSMLKLGRAQGVVIAAAISREIPIHEYAPLKIKQAITGNGQASKEQVAAMMQEKISMKVDTSAIEQEIAAHEKQLRQSYSVKARLMEEIDSLDPDDRHYIKRKADLDDRLYKMYDKIEDTENQLVAARAKKMAIEAEKLTGDNIYKVLIYFDKLYSVMDDQEKRQLMESLLSEIQIYEERQPNGQWLKSIKFKLPIIAEDMSLSLDNDAHIEMVCLLSKEAGEEQQR